MRIRNSTGRGDDSIELQMTPMIDIVFQLLVFFIMTFNVVAEEGDFNIKMPQPSIAPGAPDPQTIPPIAVRLTANPDGSLSGIYLNERAIPSFAALRKEITALVDGGVPDDGEEPQVELDCDYDLAYDYAVEAITHVSGDIDENGEVRKLIENIKFSTKNLTRD